MRKKFDVLVVGAGVAGVSAGFSLIEKNDVDVLMVEKKDVIGYPVKCGEFIPTFESIKKMIPHSKYIEKVYSLIPEKVISNRTKKIRFYSPSNHCFEFKFDGIVLKRDLLERLVAEKALKLGVKVYTSSVVRLIMGKDGFKEAIIKTSETEDRVEVRAVIGADGYPSNTAKWMGLESTYNSLNDVALAVQKTMDGVEVEEDTVEMFSGNLCAPKGYAWIIPKGDGVANVGLGVRLTHFRSKHRKRILEYLNNFIGRHPIASKRLLKAKTLNFSAKLVPVGGIVKEVQKNDVLLVGDAAGLVLAINGSGIPTAMLSGIVAGKLVAEHLNSKQTLNVYRKILEEELGKVIGRSVKYRRIADRFMEHDKLFTILLKLIGVRGVSKVLECESLF
ncbi:MAG: hypothetical protein DRO36_01395 [Candidatus Hecatellales archaeon]|nr:MAG: hypothetical protein DRO36_01395 [Candidatus Hecatellales archaeon]